MFWLRLNYIGRNTWWLSLGVILLATCASRYHLNLFMTAEGLKKKVKVEQTELIPGSQLRDPFADRKVMAGSASILVITTGTRWRQPKDTRVFMFAFDEYLKCRIYVQLPAALTADSIDLLNNSFVHLLGRYDLPAEDKIFPADSGVLVVDSVTSKNLFGTIHGRYKNRSASTLHFDGRFKVRITD